MKRLWQWLTTWDEWRGNLDGSRVVMRIKHLVGFRGWKIDLHRFYSYDDDDCFHTHPAKAIRIILWGWYCEEVLIRWPLGGCVYEEQKWLKRWNAGMVGRIDPETCHRISGLCLGPCITLWIRWPKTHEVQLIGKGWDEQRQHSAGHSSN